MQTIVVFGSSGFIGGHLLRHLDGEGFEVTSCALRAQDFSHDLLLQQLAGVDAVINVAGMAHSLPGQTHDDDYLQLNAQFPEQLARCAIEAGVKRFVHLSSVKAAQYDSSRCPNDEDCTSKPSDIYGRSKRLGEEALLALDWLDCECTILRPCLVYGPQVKANLRALITATASGCVPTLESSGQRSMLSVDDLSRAIIAVLRSGRLPQSVYIVAESKPYTVARIQAAVRVAQGKSANRHFRIQAGWLQKACAPLSILQGLLMRRHSFKQRLDKLLDTECYSGARFERASGWVARDQIEDLMPAILSDAQTRSPTSAKIP